MNSTPTKSALEELHTAAHSIFAQALAGTGIELVFDQHLHFKDSELVLRPLGNSEPVRIHLSEFADLRVVALGKAAAPMLGILLDRLPKSFKVRGLCCAPSEPAERAPDFRYYAAGHPLPNSDSFKAAQAALQLMHETTGESFVFFLISGGGSTLFELPLDPGISLDDTVAFHKALIGSGATIAEINVVRKHFSAVKGGRLAAAAPLARKLTLQLADVPLSELDALASAPTLPDRSTIEDCRAVIDRYRMAEQFPPAVRTFFARPDLPETPGDKVNFTRAQPAVNSWLLTLLSNDDLVHAASMHATKLGFRVFIDNTCDDWSYDDAARYLLDRLDELQPEHGRVCLLSGGEVTVKLGPHPGIGGRNQQFALACALALHSRASSEPVVVLSAGSDGVDGNSSAAGAIADATTVNRALAYGFDPRTSLASFDSGPLFTALGDSVVTGPTGNNLRDLRVLLAVR